MGLFGDLFFILRCLPCSVKISEGETNMILCIALRICVLRYFFNINSSHVFLWVCDFDGAQGRPDFFFYFSAYKAFKLSLNYSQPYFYYFLQSTENITCTVHRTCERCTTPHTALLICRRIITKISTPFNAIRHHSLRTLPRPVSYTTSCSGSTCNRITYFDKKIHRKH